MAARLINLMMGWHGARFTDQYANVSEELIRDTWAKGIEGLTDAEIVAGIERAKTAKFAPTCPEFFLLCRPPVDYEAAFHEAVENMQLRDKDADVWSAPAVYWAAARIGGDLRLHGYKVLASRWKRALDAAMKDVEAGRLGEVPRRQLALPEPPRRGPTEAERAALAQLRQKCHASAGARVLDAMLNDAKNEERPQC